MPIRKVLDKIPAPICSLLTLCLILWLTLAPQPAGDVEIPLFEGADKVVHAIMFGFLALMFHIDLGKLRHGAATSAQAWWCAAASLIVGVVVEWLQRAMGLGRSMEWADTLADGVGALAAALFVVISRLTTDHKRKDKPKHSV